MRPYGAHDDRNALNDIAAIMADRRTYRTAEAREEAIASVLHTVRQST